MAVPPAHLPHVLVSNGITRNSHGITRNSQRTTVRSEARDAALLCDQNCGVISCEALKSPHNMTLAENISSVNVHSLEL